ncbi:MAG: VWA domain-containing protein [Candidatus Solibacter sp.]
MRFKSTIRLSIAMTLAAAAAFAQAPPVIRTETKLVLVDVVVTGKKGVYVEDLELKNFKVWEDNKEQQLKTFSTGSDPNGPGGNKRYIVLFFDNSTMTMGEQVQARQAAGKFIESNAGPDRLMAIVNFTVGMQIAQNFTPDLDKLKQVVGSLKSSGAAPGPELASLNNRAGMMGGNGMGEYGARSLLLAIRTMAKNMSEIPGRKSMVLFTSGFPLSNEARSEANAAIDACNKANVAIYPIDVRGVAGGTRMDDPSMPGRRGRAALDAPPAYPGMALRSSGIALASSQVLRSVALFQAGVGAGRGSVGGSTGGSTPPAGGSAGGAGGSTGAPGGGSVGGNTNPGGGITRGTTPGNNNTGVGGNNGMNNNNGGGNNNDPFNRNNDPFNRNNGNDPFNRMGIPDVRGASDNQQVMYLLADGTGGFVINNTNDMAGGMQKIGKEQNSYYIVGYTPPESADGSCHTLKVKVDHGGTTVRSRAGYCNVKSKDVLAGNPIEKTLQSKAEATGTSAGTGTVAAAMRAPFFYTGANTARVAVAVEIPSESIKFEKVKGKFHSTVNLLAIAYKPDGSVGARFSDAVKLDFDTQVQANAFKEKPMHYENQFDVAAGTYNLKVVFEAGEGSFGKLETPLVINAYETKDFAISGVAISKVVTKASDADASLDAVLLEGRSPLVAGPYQFTPTGYTKFNAAERVYMYFEIYDANLLQEKRPQVAAQIRVLDAKTGDLKSDSGNVLVENFVKPGSPIVAIGLRLPVEGLAPGLYKMELKGLDATGAFATRTAEFEIVPGGPKLPF